MTSKKIPELLMTWRECATGIEWCVDPSDPELAWRWAPTLIDAVLDYVRVMGMDPRDGVDLWSCDNEPLDYEGRKS